MNLRDLKIRDLILRNWGTSTVGAGSILLGLLGNLDSTDFQSYIDWFNNVMAQDNKLLRIGLIVAGVMGLFSKDPGTPTPPNSTGGDAPLARTSEASDVSAIKGSPVTSA